MSLALLCHVKIRVRVTAVSIIPSHEKQLTSIRGDKFWKSNKTAGNNAIMTKLCDSAFLNPLFSPHPTAPHPLLLPITRSPFASSLFTHIASSDTAYLHTRRVNHCTAIRYRAGSGHINTPHLTTILQLLNQRTKYFYPVNLLVCFFCPQIEL